MKHARCFVSKKKNRLFFISILLFAIALFLFIFISSYRRNKMCYHNDIYELGKIIEKIDSNCKIIGFTGTINAIDFLNVKDFTGTHVGSIQIGAPQNWKGPYKEAIPTYNEKPYSIFVHKTGSYIVPGHDTVLSDGKIIGKDIIFDDSFDADEYYKKYESLVPNGKKLIYKLNLDIKKQDKLCDKDSGHCGKRVIKK
jgi:hypothetical protein